MPLSPTLFRAYDVRGEYPETLDESVARAIGQAFALDVLQGKPGAIAVGRDGRLSSPCLAKALSDGLRAGGAEVIDIGLGPTPMLYFAAATLPVVAGVMVTGSHNPAHHNGFKFTAHGKPFFDTQITALYEAIQAGLPPAKIGGYRVESVREAYLATLIQQATLPDAVPLRVVWDAGNGAAGAVLDALVATVPGQHTVLFGEVDGTFPNHHPDPTVAENLQDLIAAVQHKGADFGVAFDGDGDRIGVVDAMGEILWGDELLALFAADVLRAAPGATVIADVKASQTLFDEVARLGGQPLMWKTGHSHIKAKMAETGAKLAGEMSGHVFFADRYYGFDDALYAALRLVGLVMRAGEPLTALRARLPKALATPELRFDCPDLRKFTVIEEVAARLADAGAEVCTVDGVRVTTPNGWWLLRASNTQAMLVARAESADEAGLNLLKEDLRAQLALSNVALP